MKIAILIPCYNAAKFLPSLFEGIKAQTVPFDEIICYDDCSDDDTALIAEKLGAKVIAGKKNKGAAFARNRLLESTNCEWVHFHDADDLIYPSFVEKMLMSIENENVQLLCNTVVRELDRQHESIGSINYSNLSKTSDQIDYFLRNVGFASMGLYSIAALKRINGFNELLRGNEDPDLHLRLVASGYRVKCVESYLVEKVEHDNSFSHQNWFRCMHDKFKCLQHYSLILNEKYFTTLGEQAVLLSNYFYRENDPSLSKQARQFAYEMKTKKIKTSKFADFLSSTLGIKFYLWSYRRRTDLVKILSKK